MDNQLVIELQTHLIQRVQAMQEVDRLVRLLLFLDELPIAEKTAQRLFQPISKTMTVESLKMAQNFKGHDWKTANEWAKKLDIQEPTEVLLQQLSQ